MLVELDAGCRPGEHLLQARLASLERFLPQIVAVDLEHVEGVQEHGGIPALRVQPVEIGHAVIAAHDGLAVDRDRANPQTAGGLDDRRKAVAPIEPAAREQSHPSSLPANHEPVAIVLDLVHPIAPDRSMARPRRDTGRDEGERERARGGVWNIGRH